MVARHFLNAWGVFLAVALAAGAQSATPFTYKTTVGEVLVQANVLDKHGKAVNNLPQGDFTVLENGVPQKIESFSHADAPVSVGILVDNSGSMRPKRLRVDQAALNFVRASNPQGEVFIVKFNDEYQLAAPFTNSIPRMEQGLGEINPEAGTALYDAMIRGITYLSKNARHPKKVILLISDGEDDASSHSLAQAMALVQAPDAPLIYTIGIFGSDDSRSARKEASKVLQKFADASGGNAYFPKDLNEVNAITGQVARDIRLQYSLVYRSNQTTPGFRAIRVEVKDPHQKNLKAHTRNGYIAGVN